MPRKPHSSRPQRTDVAFDIERSSFYRMLSEEREAIKQHQREIEEQSGRETNWSEAIMSWVRKHRWEWLDQRNRNPVG